MPGPFLSSFDVLACLSLTSHCGVGTVPTITLQRRKRRYEKLGELARQHSCKQQNGDFSPGSPALEAEAFMAL